MTDDSRRPASGPRASRSLPPLYPIIDVDLCGLRGLDPLALARACLAGGARLLQVRRKGVAGGSAALLALARDVVAAARASGAAAILNDRADLAVMAGADGVHVGQQDLPASAVRDILGPGKLVGVSTHTAAQLDDALAGPADYVAVGPVFLTATKDTGYTPRGLELVRLAAGRGRPVVAIGGITLENARAVIDAGASTVAVIGDLFATDDVAARVRLYLDVIGTPAP